MPTHNRPRESAEEETLSRVKRIETRLTQLMIGLGIDTRSQKPQFNANDYSVVVPSIHSSIKEILDSLPESCHHEVEVYLGDSRICSVRGGGKA